MDDGGDQLHRPQYALPIQERDHHLADREIGLVHRSGAVQDAISIRLGGGQVQVRPAHPLEERGALGVLEAVPTVLPLAPQTDVDRDVEEDGEVRLQAAGCERLQRAQGVEVQPIAAALVGERRVKVSGADDPLPRVERGANAARDVLRPAGREQQRVGAGIEIVGDRAGVKDQAPDFLAEARPTWLRGNGGADALRDEPVRQVARCGALAAAFRTLEGDEAAPSGRRPGQRQARPSSGRS